MATIFQKAVRDSNGAHHILSRDDAPKVQLDGQDVTFGAQPTSTALVALTYGGVAYTIPAQDFGQVAYAGPANISPGLGSVGQSALGRLMAVAVNAGVTQATALNIGGG